MKIFANNNTTAEENLNVTEVVNIKRRNDNGIDLDILISTILVVCVLVFAIVYCCYISYSSGRIMKAWEEFIDDEEDI
jgi:hypothetical protein